MAAPRSWLGIALFALVAAPAAQAVDLKDGELIGPANAEKVKDLLPPEIYRHYAKGEYQNKYLDLGRPGLVSGVHPAPFLEATKQNRGKYVLTPEGGIARADGQPPGFITGFPFPDISASDPDAAKKIVWNYFYNWWYAGNGHFSNDVVWLTRANGYDRSITSDASFIYYQSAPEAAALDNPQDLLLRARSGVDAPADLQGTVTVSWRFRDPKLRDQNWVYVPALRRVRSVSPSNRSDGFLGSDMAQDDGQYFDGKPEDFEWKLVGEGEQLGLDDEPSNTGDVSFLTLPGGGWRILWNDKPWVGYEDPSWKGAPWAPIDSVLTKHKVWNVEGVPKDRYYLFGKLLLRFDKDDYQGFWSSKYDWKDNLLMSYQVQNGAWHTPDGGKHWMPAGRSSYQAAENMKLDRATGVRFSRSQQNPADYKIPLDPAEFNPDSLNRAGK